jgi:hypothetical protein
MNPDIILIIALVILIAVVGTACYFLDKRQTRLQATRKAEDVEQVETQEAPVKVQEPVKTVPDVPSGDPWRITVVGPGHMADPIRLLRIGSKSTSQPVWIVPKGGHPVRITTSGHMSTPCRIVAGLSDLDPKYLPLIGK